MKLLVFTSGEYEDNQIDAIYEDTPEIRKTLEEFLIKYNEIMEIYVKNFPNIIRLQNSNKKDQYWSLHPSNPEDRRVLLDSQKLLLSYYQITDKCTTIDNIELLHSQNELKSIVIGKLFKKLDFEEMN